MSQAVNPYHAPKAAVSEAAGETQPVKVFSVSGRIGRVRYIAYGFGFYLLIGVIGAILAAALGPAGVAALVVMWLALLAIGFMLTIQRCHDFNTSGWLSLVLLVPLVNLIFWFIPGTDGPNRYGAPTPANGVAVVVVVCVVPLMFFIVGILAAVAIPAYGDYTHRARVSEVILLGSPWRTAVTEYYVSNGKMPARAADLQPAPESSGKYGSAALGADGVVTLTLSKEAGSSLADKTILLRPRISGGQIASWDCTEGTLPPKYRPRSCRRE